MCETVQVGRSLDEGLYEFMEHGCSGGVGVSGMTAMEYYIRLATMSTALTACRLVTSEATALPNLCIRFICFVV